MGLDHILQLCQPSSQCLLWIKIFLLFVIHHWNIFAARSLRLNYWTQACCTELSSTAAPSVSMKQVMWKKVLGARGRARLLGKLDQWCFVTTLTLGSLVFTKGEPSFFCLLAESSPPFCRCSCSWGKRIYAILDVLPCSSHCIFFHIRPEETRH